MIALIAMLAAAAPGGTTYLQCVSHQPSGSTVQWSLAMHEDQGTVDVSSTANNGAGDGRKAASFTAGAVQFMDFTLSRTNLTMSREVSFGGMDMGEERGQCQVVQAPNRAF